MMEQVQNATLNDALKALADYRTAAGITPVKKQTQPLQSSSVSQAVDSIEITNPTPMHPRLGRYVNIWA